MNYKKSMNYKKLVNGLFLASSDLMWKKNNTRFSTNQAKKDDIPLVLLKLDIKNREIIRTESIKFLGVSLDKNLSWKPKIKYTENQISKNIALLFRARLFLNKKWLLSLYYLYIQGYINYGSVSWEALAEQTWKK